MTHFPFDSSKRSLKGHQWVVFGPDWGRYPSVSQHLFSQFLGESPVIWVETVGLRSPSWSWRDLGRCLQKLTDFLTGRRVLQSLPTQGLTIVSPMTLPFTGFALVRRFNSWRVRCVVGRAMQRLGFNQPTLVVTVPSQCDYVGRLGEELSVYYCIDQYELWPGMNPDHVRKMEAQLITSVGCVVVPSVGLKKRFIPSGKPILVLEHGVDLEHFKMCRDRLPATGPVELVYFGSINERIDIDLLVRLAKAVPEASIRLIGPVTTHVAPLLNLANVHLEGVVSYQDLPKAVASAHLFMLPFRLDELSKSCSPIKLKEYLACGRPAIATVLPDGEDLREYIHLESDSERFVQWVSDFVNGEGEIAPDSGFAYVEGQTWAAKAAKWVEFIHSVRAGRDEGSRQKLLVARL